MRRYALAKQPHSYTRQKALCNWHVACVLSLQAANEGHAPACCRRSPHEFRYREPVYAIDENFERADGAIMPEGRASVDRIALHHYVLKCAQALLSLSRVHSKGCAGRRSAEGRHSGQQSVQIA